MLLGLTLVLEDQLFNTQIQRLASHISMTSRRMATKTQLIMSTRYTTNPTNRWIGLVHVSPLPGNRVLGKSKGAFVAAVGDADTPAIFLALVRSEFEKLEFEIKSLEDVELLDDRMARHELSAELIHSIAEISTESPLALGSFHSYLKT